jgi:alkanesulfonate monooxygenase SsuD/methylene tetrahydromethanopterin reductase-like flavin-dependent oxidoreductase (luciferase family)
MRYSTFSVNDHHPRLARSVPQLYAQVMRQCELAESLGYDTFFCAEHHFHEYGVVPDPAVMLSALAQRTKRIRLGTAISILTFHDPRRIAETYSMLDMMSGGRLVFGVGSGYLAHEFVGYGINPQREIRGSSIKLIESLLGSRQRDERGGRPSGALRPHAGTRKRRRGTSTRADGRSRLVNRFKNVQSLPVTSSDPQRPGR